MTSTEHMTERSHEQEATTASPLPRSKHNVQRIDLSWLPRYSGLILLAVIVGLFAALRPDTFATGQNLRIILGGQAIAVVLALAVLLPLSADVLDISVAGTMGLAVITVGWFQFQGFNPILAIVLALLIGIAVGAINSMVIIKFRVPSLIATLGMASILDATGFWVTSGNGVSSGMSSGFERFGQAKLWGTPVTVFYMLGVAAVLYYVLEQTPAGRYVRAIGGNAEASAALWHQSQSHCSSYTDRLCADRHDCRDHLRGQPRVISD